MPEILLGREEQADQRTRWEIHRAKSAKVVEVARTTQIVKRSA